MRPVTDLPDRSDTVRRSPAKVLSVYPPPHGRSSRRVSAAPTSRALGRDTEDRRHGRPTPKPAWQPPSSTWSGDGPLHAAGFGKVSRLRVGRQRLMATLRSRCVMFVATIRSGTRMLPGGSKQQTLSLEVRGSIPRRLTKSFQQPRVITCRAFIMAIVVLLLALLLPAPAHAQFSSRHLAATGDSGMRTSLSPSRLSAPMSGSRVWNG